MEINTQGMVYHPFFSARLRRNVLRQFWGDFHDTQQEPGPIVDPGIF